MDNQSLGLLGATSLVGVSLLQIAKQNNRQVVAFSRKEQHGTKDECITWRKLSQEHADVNGMNIPFWISVAPIWVLPEYFSMLESLGIRRIVVLSSTSVLIKSDSSDISEQRIAHRLAEGENSLRDWAESRNIEWTILRPTLIYGLGMDKNITEIARFILRFGFFPIFGKANGLRQPIHAQDVAVACISAIESNSAANQVYNLSGGETLTYREMVNRVFGSLNRQPRLFTIPLAAFQLAVFFIRLSKKYRHWSSAMAERMNRDLVFDSSSARNDFNFAPRPFLLTNEDCPKQI